MYMKVYRFGAGWRVGVCTHDGGPAGFKSSPGNVGLFIERVPLEPDRSGPVPRRRADGGVRWLGWYAAAGAPCYLELLTLFPDAALSLLWLERPPVDGLSTLVAETRAG